MTHINCTHKCSDRFALGQTLKVISHKGVKGSLWGVCAALMWTLAVPTQAQQYLQQPEGTRQASRADLTGQIEDLADPFAQTSVWVERNQGRLVFYRPRQGALGTSASQPDSLQNDAPDNVVNYSC